MKSHSIAVTLSLIILLSCFTTGLAVADTLWTQNGDNIYNTNSGNVGIGTTNPMFNLHIGSSDNAKTYMESGEGKASLIIHGNPSQGYGGAIGLFPKSPADNRAVLFYIDGLLDNSKAGMALLNNGNVGIGTTEPSADLHVLGNINFTDSLCEITNNYETKMVNYISSTLSDDNIYGYVQGLRIDTTLPQGKQVGDTSNIKYIYGLSVAQSVRGSGTHLYGNSVGVHGLSYVRENGIIHGNSISIYGQGAIATDGHVTGDLIGVYGNVYATGGQVDGKRWAGYFNGNTYVSGNVGIGTTSPQSKLAVNGTITAKEVKVLDTGWSDFVFEDTYNLSSLDNVESYIKENKHLPGIPSAKEVKEKGLAMSDMLARQMQKIEELTLYLIELKKENEQMNKNNEKLRERVSALENTER